MKTLLIAIALVAGGCGAEESSIEAAAVVGQPLVIELGGSASPASSVPEGIVLMGDRLEWTPSAEHEGEHAFTLEVVREGAVAHETVRVMVEPADPRVVYGGCECGSKPNPPRPRAEALGVVLLGAWFRRRRRTALIAAR